MDYIGISTIIRGVLMLVAFVVLLWLFDLLAAVIGMVAITFLTAIIYDFQKAKKLARFTTIAGKKILSLLKKCFPLMLVLLVITLIVSFARFSLQRMYGDEALGIYVAASNPTLIIQGSAFLLFAPLINLFAEALKESNKKKFLKIFMAVLTVVSAITVTFTTGAYFFGEWLLRILFGESITEHAYLMVGASVAAGFTALVWFMNIVFTAIRDIKGVFICNMIGMIICLATSDVLLKLYGLDGTNYVMIISQGAAVLLALIRFFWVLNRKKDLFP
jgi:O-antigen/teichoic acid export membrane protein